MQFPIIRKDIDLKHPSTEFKAIEAHLGETGRILEISLFNDGKLFTPAPDCKVIFAAKKSDGTCIFSDCTMKEGKIYYKFTDQTCAILGMYPAEIRLYTGEGDLIITARFHINIEDSVFHTGDDITSRSETDALDSLICKSQKVNTEITEKLKNGDFTGASAYDIAVSLGFQGTEEEWIASLRYDHSSEFSSLAQQVQAAVTQADDHREAAQSASFQAREYSEAAKAQQEQADASADSASAAAQAAEAARSAAEAQKVLAQDAGTASQSAAQEAVKASESAKAHADKADAFAKAAADSAVSVPSADVLCNALTGTAAGPVIAVNDVSPLMHTVKCQLSGSTDLSAVTVTKYAGNLQNPDNIGQSRIVENISWTNHGDGTVSAHGTAAAISPFSVGSDSIYYPAGDYIFSLGAPYQKGMMMVLYCEGGMKPVTVTSNCIRQSASAPWKVTSGYLYIQKGYSVSHAIFRPTFRPVFPGDNGVYSPYMPPVSYHPDHEGRVRALEPCSPAMVLMVNSPDTILKVQYNRDINLFCLHMLNRLSVLENSQLQLN